MKKPTAVRSPGAKGIFLLSFVQQSLLRRLLASFLGLSFVLSLSGAAGLFFIDRINAAFHDLSQIASPMEEASLEMIAAEKDMILSIREMINDNTGHLAAEFDARIDEFADASTTAAERLASLAQSGGIELDTDALIGREAVIVEKARTMRLRHQERLQTEATAERILAEFHESAAQIEDVLGALINESEQTMVLAEDRSRTLIQAGDATTQDLGAFIEEIFNQSYPVVKLSQVLKQFTTDLEQTARRHTETTDIDSLSAISKQFASSFRRATSMARRMSRTPGVNPELIAKATEHVNTLAELVQNDGGLFQTHTRALTIGAETEQVFAEVDALLKNYTAQLQEVVVLASNIQSDAVAGAEASVEEAAISIVALIVAGLAFGILLGILLARGISRPVQQLTTTMQRLSGGDLTGEVQGMERPDEIGRMAAAVNIFKQNALDLERMAADRKAQEEAVRRDKESTRTRLVTEFDSSVGRVVREVAEAIANQHQSAEGMAGIARQLRSLISDGSAAADQTTANVQTVASASDQLSASVRDMASQVSRSAGMAGNALAQSHEVRDRISRLSASAQRIGEVIQLISSIASQTNLLALNATIEAARAGSAGKGFAVVANEVKALANQTAKATSEITAQVVQVQEATSHTVQGMEGIGTTIQAINEAASAIAAAVEEQSAATGEIARSLQEAATGTKQLATFIGDVGKAVTTAQDAADNVRDSSKELDRQTGDLKSMVGHFLNEVQAA